MFEYGYNNYSVKNLLNGNDIVTQIEVKNATKDTKFLDLQAKNSLPALLSNQLPESEIVNNIQLNTNIKAPIELGETLGTVSYNIDGIEYKTDLIASHSVEKSKFWNYTINIGFGVLLLILLYKSFYNKRKKNFR